MNGGDCETLLATANARLLKALDAYDKALALADTRLAQVEAMKAIDKLKDAYIAVKDQFIAAQAELIAFYEKKNRGVKSKLTKLLETAGKVALIAAGVLVGRGL